MALPSGWQYGSQGPVVWRAWKRAANHSIVSEEAASQARCDQMANNYETDKARLK